MLIRQFEIFHGIALAKLLRSDRPVSLRLIETHPASEDWQVYAINDADLFAKHRASSTPLTRGKGGYSWQFIFSPKEISRITRTSDRPMHVALICGQSSIDKEMEICFLYPDDIKKVFPLESDKPFSLTVKSMPGKGLKIIVGRKIRCSIPRRAIQNWDIPGK